MLNRVIRPYILSLIFVTSVAHGFTLNNHQWPLSDMNEMNLSEDQLISQIRSNWDLSASEDDLAHLNAFQWYKKFNIQSAKVFLVTGYNENHVANVLNFSNELMVFDTKMRSIDFLNEWIYQRSSRHCTQVVNASEEFLFLFQINKLNTHNDCYYIIMPQHTYKQMEVYPISSPKDFDSEDIINSCFESTDRKLFKKDRKRCRIWFENF